MPDATPRLSATERLILELLDGDERYGLELVNGSDGRLKRGTIYVTLGRMEEKGFVTSHPEVDPPAHGGLRRRLYKRTPLGRRVMSAWTKFLAHLQPELER
jgi:PadR family transcriptional regulator, regulatory protein PadR